MEVTYGDLIMGRRIGQGACSSVNMARHLETGEMFAVKMFNVYDEVDLTETFYHASHISATNMTEDCFPFVKHRPSNTESIKTAHKGNLHALCSSV